MAGTRASGEIRQLSYVDWSAIVAGAVAAAALAFVLHSFAIAIGLSISSTAPTWRDGSAVLWILSGLYLLLVAIASYGFGGYLAGAMRATADLTVEQTEVRDGTHGLLVWALATLLTALIAIAGAGPLSRLAAPGASSGPSASVGGENIIAFDIDRLFRADKLPQESDREERRSEAARILLTVSGHEGIRADDRSYLVRMVSNTTGLAPADAEKRVAEVAASARENIRRARQSSVILAFMAGASALVGAAVAWFAAGLGGRHRESPTAPSMQWGWMGPRTENKRVKS
jgi:hypothetical protein